MIQCNLLDIYLLYASSPIDYGTKHASQDTCIQSLDCDSCFHYFSHVYLQQQSFLQCNQKISNSHQSKKHNNNTSSLRKLSMNGFGSHIKKFICDLEHYQYLKYGNSESFQVMRTYANKTLSKIGSQFQYFNNIDSIRLTLPYISGKSPYWKIITPLFTVMAQNSDKLISLFLEPDSGYQDFVKADSKSNSHKISFDIINDFLFTNKFGQLKSLTLKSTFLLKFFNVKNDYSDNLVNIRHLSLVNVSTSIVFWTELIKNGKKTILRKLEKNCI